jgi:hypothetical protein
LPSVATMAGRSPACTQDRRVELRWPCSARTGSETLNPQHPVGGTDAHSDRWAYTSCHGLAAAPSCPTGGRPPLVAGPRTGASTRHPRLLQPGRRPQRLSVSSEVLHETRAADQEDRGIRGRTSGDPLLAILQRYVEPSQAAEATDSCSPDSPRRRCPTQPSTRPAAATGSGLGLSALGNVRPRRAQVEQDDRQRRDAQEQVKEVLGDSERDRERRAEQQPSCEPAVAPKREVADADRPGNGTRGCGAAGAPAGVGGQQGRAQMQDAVGPVVSQAALQELGGTVMSTASRKPTAAALQYRRYACSIAIPAPACQTRPCNPTKPT